MQGGLRRPGQKRTIWKKRWSVITSYSIHYTKLYEGCRVDSLVSVDDRGQMVLPKELRDKAGIKGGDKLAVIRVITSYSIHYTKLYEWPRSPRTAGAAPWT